MKTIQIRALMSDYDAEPFDDLVQQYSGASLGIVDCNRLTGLVVTSEDLPGLQDHLAAHGWHRCAGQAGNPEGIAVVWFKGPTRPIPPEEAGYRALMTAARALRESRKPDSWRLEIRISKEFYPVWHSVWGGIMDYSDDDESPDYSRFSGSTLESDLKEFLSD